jgi:hypothetical protein
MDEVSKNKIKVNNHALEELRRMKNTSPFVPVIIESKDCQMDTFFRLICLNINSLKPHFSSLQRDEHLPLSHVACLTETWMKTTEPTPEVPNHATLITNNTSGRRGGGLAMFIHHDIIMLKQYNVPNIKTEYQLVVISPKLLKSVRICVLSIYHNPRLTAKDFLPELETILTVIPQGLPSFIVGDFNIDILTNEPTQKKLQNVMRYYGYIQYVHSPTHRKGGLLDHVYFNRTADGLLVDTVPTYYSDHFLLSLVVPWACLH